MKNLKTIFSLFFILSWMSTNAQIKLVKRIESEKHRSFTVFSDKTGAISYYTEGENKNYERHIVWVDSQLNPVKTIINVIPHKLKRGKSSASSNKIVYLNYSKKGSYKLSVSRKTGGTKMFSGVLPKKSAVLSFSMMEERLIAFIKANKNYFIRSFDLKTGKYKDVALPVSGYKKPHLDAYGKHDDEYHIQFEVKADEGGYKHLVFKYDAHAKLIGKPLSFDLGEKKQITDLRLSNNNDGSYLISGTYSLRSRKGYSQGFFTGRLSAAGKTSALKYHNFLDLEHFTEYLSEKRQKKVEKKKAKKEKKGKELYGKFLATTHGFYLTENKSYVVSEFYVPTYRTEHYTTYVNGQSVTKTKRVFDGYLYTHALVSSITKEGDIEWTNIFKMHVDYKPFFVKRFIRKSVDENDNLELSYSGKSFIYFKTFSDDGKTMRDESISVIETLSENDKVKYTTSTGISYWYDDYYIVTGYQKIKNKEADKKKRKIYFINKIKY